MQFETQTFIEIIKAVVIAFLGGTVARYFERKPHLVVYYDHVASFRATPPGGTAIDVFSHGIILRNSGNYPATNVRIHHNVLPDFKIFPPIIHQVEKLPDGSVDIVIPSLVPKEQITVSYLYFPPLIYDRVNAGIKCDQGFAQQKEVVLQPRVRPWLRVLVMFLMLMGFVCSLYLIFMGFQYLLGFFGL